MVTKSLTSEAIALTEKKMDMSLDDIIKMSKTKVDKSKKQRVSNDSRKPTNGNQDRSMKMQQYMNSRSTVRQGVLSQRRTNFQGNSFTLAHDAARKAMVAPFRNGGFNRNRAVNWNRPRVAGPLRRPGTASTGSYVSKPQQQQQQQQQRQRQQPSQRREMMPNQNPKTLDSLFASMKDQRMKASTRPNNGGTVRRGGGGGGVNFQPRQPWLKGRFGNYRR